MTELMAFDDIDVRAVWKIARGESDNVQTVLCHGCFDLLHLGHIRHLQEAAGLGARLVVSVTADEHVNKGIGRPHFSAKQRAEALQALECVDQVIINTSGSTGDIIRRVHPDIYVKGIDYAETGLTDEENIALAEVGAKVHFTTAEKFSSTKILNAEKFDEATLRYLADLRDSGAKDRILKAFEDADKLSIAFVGETIIDEYRFVQGLGKASKELMLAVVETRREEFEGGAIAASKHCEWKRAEWFANAFKPIRKTRFIGEDFNQKLFDVYSVIKTELQHMDRNTFYKHLKNFVDQVDVIIALDFGHGFFDAEAKDIVGKSKFLAVNAQTNAGNYGYNLITQYKKADFVCIDEPEARLAIGNITYDIESSLNNLCCDFNYKNMIVTHGKFGSRWRSWDGNGGYSPVLSSAVTDTMGAGDAVMATAAPLIAAGLSVEEAAFVGNVAGAIKVSILGHRRHVERQELIKTIEAWLS